MPRPKLSVEERQRGHRLGVALADARHNAGIAAERAAHTAGVSVETVRRIERGNIANPGVFTVAAIAEAIQIAVGDLIAQADEGTEQP